MADGSLRRRLHTVVVLVNVITQATARPECHCLDECNDKFQCTSGRGCHSGWSGPTCQSKNIALMKPTDQSSTVNDCQWASDDEHRRKVCGVKTSDLAVDGAASSQYWSGSCIHTYPGQTPVWWYVDLEKTYLVNRIKIYFGNDARLLLGFLVKVDNTVCYKHSSRYPPTSPVSVTCTTPVYGRTVRVELPTLKESQYILNLCEVEIYECADDWYGNECGHRCFCRSPSEVCDKSSGHCQSGCPDGYKGTSCGEQCADGYYGSECKGRCGHCRKNFICDRKSGHCSEGCKPGWQWPRCFYNCSKGTYGENCSHPCGKCVDECNPVDGTCDQKGCMDGWTGHTCKRECPDRQYGFNCSQQCGQCLSQGVCNKTTGHCPGEICENGWMGSDCKEECEDGSYGEKCSRTCGKCRGGMACDKIVGSCRDCEKGYSLPKCKECEEGSYGMNCSHSCGHCVGQCDPVDGTCDKKGCEKGWGGDKCIKLDFMKSTVNIAGSGTVKVFDVIEFRPPVAIQGSPFVTTDGNTSLASCVTISGTQPSWKVSFENQHTFYGLQIYMPRTAQRFDVKVSVDGKVCFFWSSPSPHPDQNMFQCYEPVTGKSITIYVPWGPNTTNLSLCEVHVYASTINSNTITVVFPLAPVISSCVAILGTISCAVAIICVLRRRKVGCFKRKEDMQNYEGITSDPDPQKYTPIKAPVYQNEPRACAVYENDDNLVDEHIYVEPAVPDGDNTHYEIVETNF